MYTDHKDLTCKNFNTNRVLRQRLILGDYDPEIQYIQGKEKYSVRCTITIAQLWESKDYVKYVKTLSASIYNKLTKMV